MERIHVTVRTRPLPPEDAKTSPWRISGNSISISSHSSKFEFDRIFGEHCKTREVYEARTKDIVASAVCGFNVRVLEHPLCKHLESGKPSRQDVGLVVVDRWWRCKGSTTLDHVR
ncbi:Kinesin-like protein KIN-7O [Sarracenia purpurea var. burkii]